MPAPALDLTTSLRGDFPNQCGTFFLLGGTPGGGEGYEIFFANFFPLPGMCTFNYMCAFVSTPNDAHEAAW